MSIRLNYQEAALRVCVDSTENGSFCGRIYGQRLSAPISFTDIHDFVVQIDALLDVQQFPQAFQRIRSFTGKDTPDVPAVLSKDDLADRDAVDAAQGHIATFLLQIYSKRNASWQGAIDWIDDSEAQQFSSTLEFLKQVSDRLA